MNAYRRGFTIVTALVSGFIIGALFAALMFYSVLPLQSLVGEIPPSFLSRPTNGEAGYRELYVSGLANQYKSQINRGIPSNDALNDIRARLGVNSGDASPLAAAQMARDAFETARTENIKDVEKTGIAQDADKGYFTVVDQTNLGELAALLEASQNDEAKPNQLEVSRRNLLLLGLLGLLLASILSAFAIYWAFGFDGRSEVATAPRAGGIGGMTQQVIRNIPFGRSAQPVQPAPPAQNVVVVQQPPIVVQSPIPSSQQSTQVAMAQPIAVAADPNATGHMHVAPTVGETFLANFDPTSYRHGDDAYEESFTIMGGTGEYLGECGVSIADRLDLATPSKVCALGVWVFDKNDPQFKSVMKVLMTPNAYNDPIIRNKLARLGDHVLAQNGMFDIATETMRVEATVSDLAVNPAGYFDTVNLAFNVYRKGSG